MAKTRITLKVVPGASRSEVVGWMGDQLKVRVAAPPEKGKANRAVGKLLADALGLPAANIEIVAGNASPRKVVEVCGLDAVQVRQRLTV